MHFEKVSPVARQSAYQDKIAERIACGDRVLPGERNQSRSLAGEQRVAPDEQRTGVLFHNRRENRVEVAFAARFEDLNLLPDARRGLTNFPYLSLRIRSGRIEQHGDQRGVRHQLAQKL